MSEEASKPVGTENGSQPPAARPELGRRDQTIGSIRPAFNGEGRFRDTTILLLDTSERERAMRSYRTLVENLPVAVYRFTMGGSTPSPFNDDNIARMTGYLVVEIQGSEFHPIYSLIIAAHRKRVRKAIRTALAEMSPFRVEYSIRHRDGLLRHFLDCGRPSADGGDLRQIDGVILDLTEHKRLEEQLEHSKLEIQHLSDHLSVIQEVERAAIARELHDGLGQSLAAARARLSTLLKRKTEPWTADLTEIGSILQHSAEELQSISAGLRPPILDNVGLLPALTWLCREFRAIAPGLNLSLDVRLSASEIPQAISKSVYRIVQESLSNVFKHARATKIVVALSRCRRKIVLEVTDNGTGFDPRAVPGAKSDPKHGFHGFGLRSIQQRGVLSGGTISIRSAPGKGTAIRLEWPVDC